MSERTVQVWEVLWIVAYLFIAGTGLGIGEYYAGQRAGRAQQKAEDAAQLAEQKAWIDKWYQKFPNVKETDFDHVLRGWHIRGDCGPSGPISRVLIKDIWMDGPHKGPCTIVDLSPPPPKHKAKPASDVPAKEIINEHAWMKNKPCDPPMPKDSNIACFDWVAEHEGWTCDDKKRVLLQSVNGNVHCFLPGGAGQPEGKEPQR